MAMPNATDMADADRPWVLPTGVGIGFKPAHLQELLEDPAPPRFVEVHAENYLGAGGAPHAQLRAATERCALSIHGVGLSLGGEDPVDRAHLARIAALVARYEPASFSEHLAWSTHAGHFYNDLLPVRYDGEALARICSHVMQVQDALRRPILIENPSTYLAYAGSTLEEPDFLAELVRRTDCGLLLDVNNVWVTCSNLQLDPVAYLQGLPLHAVGEIHLSGHSRSGTGQSPLLIDDHGSCVTAEVWELYASALRLTGPRATLIEWDSDVPDYTTVRAEARRAEDVLARWTPEGAHGARIAA